MGEAHGEAIAYSGDLALLINVGDAQTADEVRPTTQNAINIVTDWCGKNVYILPGGKCSFAEMGWAKHRLMHLTIGEEALGHTCDPTYLGVTISWNYD